MAMYAKGKVPWPPRKREESFFTENAFHEFRREKIEQVWSVIDKAAIEAQL
jgi:predicted ester cyclase